MVQRFPENSSIDLTGGKLFHVCGFFFLVDNCFEDFFILKGKKKFYCYMFMQFSGQLGVQFETKKEKFSIFLFFVYPF